jgi:hypothetical protein
MLDFAEEVIEFKLKGNKHQVSKPNNGQIKNYTHKLSCCKTNEEKEAALVGFLEVLGLEESVYDSLSPVQTGKLIESLYEAEKN